MRTGTLKTVRLSIIVSIILAISLAFLYLLQRQQIYDTIKNTHRSLVEQETQAYKKTSEEWSALLYNLNRNSDFVAFSRIYGQQGKKISSTIRNNMETLFNSVSRFSTNQIYSLKFVDVDGREVIVSENGETRKKLKNVARAGYFKQGMVTAKDNLSKTVYDTRKTNAFIHKSLPIFLNGQRLGVLILSLDMKMLIEKYRYLLVTHVTDHIVVLTKQGDVLYQSPDTKIAKKQIAAIYTSIKQTTASSPVIEDKQNIWSYVKNNDYGFYLLFESTGERITNALNEEYKKIGIVFSASSFILVLLVFWSARSIQRQQGDEDSQKVMTQQRSVHFASMSDEIRPPINALLGSLMTLSETELDNKQLYYSDTAKKSAECLLELMNEFQDFSKIGKGEFVLEKIEFDLRATVHDITELMSGQAYKKGLELSCLVGSEVPKRVVGDATRLRQVMINLMSFAIQYTGQGEVSVYIGADKKDENNCDIKLDIIDTGNLVDQQTMSKHFQMFAAPVLQEPENYTSEGLGLALSRQLVSLMGGKLIAEENSTGGNTFQLSIPMPIVNHVEPRQSKVSLTKKRILIVGEIETNRTSLSHAFSKWGMSGASMDEFPRVTNILRDARISGKGFDVCIIDVSLTSSSDKAFKAVDDIRKEFNEDELALVILTVQGAAGDVKKASEMGVQAYLTKPISRSTMRQTLIRILDTRLDHGAQIVTRHSLKEGEHKNINRILAAVSDIKIKKMMVKHFAKAGYQVDFAENGDKVRDAVKGQLYNMFLMDINLKGMNVLSFSKDFRSNEVSFNSAISNKDSIQSHTPLIALLKSSSNKRQQECRQAGFDDVLIQPLSIEHIQNIIDEYLEQHAIPKLMDEIDDKEMDSA